MHAVLSELLLQTSNVACNILFLFIMIPPPPRPTLFPYTTLFRSLRRAAARLGRLLGGVLDALLLARAARQGGMSGEHGEQQGVKDRKSTRLNSSHVEISYAVFCLKKKRTNNKVGIRIDKIDRRCR